MSSEQKKPAESLVQGLLAEKRELKVLLERGRIASRSGYVFRHGAKYALPNGLPLLFAVYHPSQQNTQTGRVTPAMYRRELAAIKRFLAREWPR